jgi:hypothetical protein
VQDAVLPAVDFAVPIGHTVHASARVLSVAPAFAKYPAIQVFAVKVVHDVSLEAPVAGLNVPEAQRVHDD